MNFVKMNEIFFIFLFNLFIRTAKRSRLHKFYANIARKMKTERLRGALKMMTDHSKKKSLAMIASQKDDMVIYKIFVSLVLVPTID